MFTVGQKVVCINNKTINGNRIPPPLKMGGIYVVQGLHECLWCGCKNIDVGLSCDDSLTCYCGNPISQEGIWWCNEKRFAPLEEKKDDNTENIVKELINESLTNNKILN